MSPDSAEYSRTKHPEKNQLPVALILGAGAGVGGAIGHRFAKGGYHVCLCRRSDQQGLSRSVQRLQQSGYSASGHLLDATKPNSIEELVQEIETTIGTIRVAIYNLGAQFGSRTLTNTSTKQMELGFRLGVLGLFRLAQCVLPTMKPGGAFLVTSSTAAMRGDAGQHAHAAAMGGRRMLCQSLNAEYAKKGVHVAHVVVDGPVDAPDTLGKLLGLKRFEQLKSSRLLMDPEAIAETYWHLTHQPPSAWTFEMDLRSQDDMPWWNSSKL